MTGRTWRRFRRRTHAAQTRVLGAVAIVVALLTWVAVSSKPLTSASPPNTVVRARSSVVDLADTRAPGVMPTTVRVVFPVVSLTSLAGSQGFAKDIEYGWQEKAIHTFVDDINRRGVAGRHIDAEIARFDPTDRAGMRALCKRWTEGDGAAFAVVDGLGAWTGDNQLCVAQEGHTPMIGQWTTISDWTNLAAPYLWWTGADQTALLDTVISWGRSSGALAPDHRVGILVGDRATDQTALHTVVLPALARIGITDPVVSVIPAGADDAVASVATKAPLAVQQFREAKVTTVIPLVPFNAFFPYLQAETQQRFFPRLLLSDYESTIQIGLGLVPIPYEKALNGQQGITTLTLGASDDTRPASDGGYNPGVRGCYATWTATNAPPPLPQGPYLEAQGPVVAWCQAIRLFARAASNAGHDLNHRTFVQAMSRVHDIDGTMSPTLTYGPDRFSGPTDYRVVRIHDNVPPSGRCALTWQKIAQGTCWVVEQDWKPLVTS